MSGYEWEPRERGVAAALAVGMLSAIMYPVWQNWRPKIDRKDGFPLSYYPMFSEKRPRAHPVRFTVGIRADGSRYYIPSKLLGNGGLNQVRRQLKRVIDGGQVGEFVKVVAARVATDERFHDAERVQIIQGLFDLDECMLNREMKAETETVLAEAEVLRPSPAPDGIVPSAATNGGTRPAAVSQVPTRNGVAK